VRVSFADTATAGAKSGTATVTLVSDGTFNGGTTTALPSQSVSLAAEVYRLAEAGSAAPNPVTFANARVGDVRTQALNIGNTAVNDGYSEGLRAAIGGTSGNVSAAGSTGLIAAGSSGGGMSVTLDTSTAGAKSGSVTIALQSDGAGSSGYSALDIGTQTVDVSGSVYRLAEAGAVAPNPVTFANARVGDVRTQALTIGNTAAADGFSEGLRASAGGASGNLSASGSTGLIAAGSSGGGMSVTLDTSSAGAKSGSAVVSLQSDGAGSSGFSALDIGTQSVTASGNVYQLAAGTLNSAPLNFGTVQVGQSVSQTLSISNGASGPAGFVEDLNARFGSASGTGAAAISGTGQITGLQAGATNASGMVVNVDTSSARTVNGSIAVDFYSAGAVNGVSNGLGELGVGSAQYGVSGTIEAVANVVDQAKPVLGTSSVNLGNVRIGSASPTAAGGVTNQATGNQQAALNASIAGNAPITASGSFNLLAPGATDGASLRVGMNTSAAGAVNGSATVSFVSDASNIGNCAPNCQMTLASQSVAVTGAVYRLANPLLETASVTLAARVGDAAPVAAIGVRNASPDAYTEGLKASLGAAPAGFAASGGIANLAAGGADAGSLKVSLDTATAGSFSGPLAVGFASTGEGTTGAADLALASGAVSLSGKVYTAAAAQVAPTAIDFGIVHKGEVIATRNVTVSNAAAITGLNDVLRGSFGGAGGPFAASGNLGAGVAAGASDAASFGVSLDTANAGVFSGTATASFASHNEDMADLSLGTSQVALSAQVNDYANANVVKRGGAGTLSRAGQTYTLDLGTLFDDSGLYQVSLGVLNDVFGPSDLLEGEFDTGLSDDFALSGFGAFAGLDAGGLQDGLLAALDTDLLTAGTYIDTIVLHAAGSNASGFRGALDDIVLVLRGTVVERTAGTVPEPGTLGLMLLGLFALMRRMRRLPR
jgi:hypothetical protein